MRSVIMLCIAVALVMTGCSNKGAIAGATSETTNGFSTVVVGTSGYPEVNAEVYVREADKLGGEDSVTAMTDSSGKFEIEEIPQGNYCIEIVGKTGYRAKLSWIVDSTEEELTAPTAVTVQKPGSILGTVSSDDSSLIIEIPGLNRRVRSLNSGGFVVDSLPVGDVEVILSTEKDGEIDNIIVHIESGKQVDIGNVQVSTMYSADSIIVAEILSQNNINMTVESVTERNKMRITELKIQNMGEKFTYLSPNIRYLALKKLDIPGNRLDSIPSEVTEISTLEYIDLSHNGLKKLPENIGNLEKCSTIDIENNDLTNLPESIVELEDVQYSFIYVNYNYLEYDKLSYKVRHWLDENSKDDEWADKQKNSR